MFVPYVLRKNPKAGFPEPFCSFGWNLQKLRRLSRIVVTVFQIYFRRSLLHL